MPLHKNCRASRDVNVNCIPRIRAKIFSFIYMTFTCIAMWIFVFKFVLMFDLLNFFPTNIYPNFVFFSIGLLNMYTRSWSYLIANICRISCPELWAEEANLRLDRERDHLCLCGIDPISRRVSNVPVFQLRGWDRSTSACVPNRLYYNWLINPISMLPPWSARSKSWSRILDTVDRYLLRICRVSREDRVSIIIQFWDLKLWEDARSIV